MPLNKTVPAGSVTRGKSTEEARPAASTKSSFTGVMVV